MCSLAVGSGSFSVCVNRRYLRCTIWAAVLRTASSSRCAAAPIGEVLGWGLCHRPSQSGFLDQGIPEEVFSGLVCMAVGWPAFVLL